MNHDFDIPLLDGWRVLDLSDEKGLLCGKILGDLGADVLKIESPGGDPSRNIGPFYKDMVHPEKSLFWMAYNLNKRGITLNLDTTDGREIFKRLVGTADFIIESFDPGYMTSLGLGYPELEADTAFGHMHIQPDGSANVKDSIVQIQNGEMTPLG